MANSNRPAIDPAAFAAEIVEQGKRQALFDSVVTDLGGATFEAELNGPNYDAAVDKLLDGLAAGSL